MQTHYTNAGLEREHSAGPVRLRRLSGAVITLILAAFAASHVVGESALPTEAVVRSAGHEGVSVAEIPAVFESHVARQELLAVAQRQSQGLLVPTWLPAEGMTIGRSVTDGDGNYDLWFIGGDARHVHVVARLVGVEGSPLVEVLGFSEADAARVRDSLRPLAA